ncbi:hypothetical protein NPIL_664581 [Nephila pilipes]|uniref:Secreted protein n=1 Tax=Nephila pilipes TaxID=299642 RepID=A0A8X6MXV1_NEPPI|nr:hypothetical protein NPIL_664581 [Nephila pilipes]
MRALNVMGWFRIAAFASQSAVWSAYRTDVSSAGVQRFSCSLWRHFLDHAVQCLEKAALSRHSGSGQTPQKSRQWPLNICSVVQHEWIDCLDLALDITHKLCGVDLVRPQSGNGDTCSAFLLGLHQRRLSPTSLAWSTPPLVGF